MNATEPKAGFLVVICPMNEMVWKQEYQMEKTTFAMTAIILNILSFPVTILMNALVIVAVKTRPRLQSKYNILLASLAGTDLIVAAASQPSFIAVQIQVIKGLSLNEYCRCYNDSHLIFIIPFLASPYHLTLASVERFVAIKYMHFSLCDNCYGASFKNSSCRYLDHCVFANNSAKLFCRC